MNYTFDKSKCSKEKLTDILICQNKIKGYSKIERPIKRRILLSHYAKSYNLSNEANWNYVLYYFMELGFNYSEILTAYMELND